MATFKVTAVYEVAEDTDLLAKRRINPKAVIVEVFIRARNEKKASELAYYEWQEQSGSSSHDSSLYDHEWMSEVVQKVNGRGVELNNVKINKR
jgi:hypothetical protein